MNRYCLLLLLAGIAASPARAQELSAQELFKRVSPSVVTIEIYGDKEKESSPLIATGSGVVIPTPDRKGAKFSPKGSVVATNCHLADKAKLFFVIRQGKQSGVGIVFARDADRDLCLVDVRLLDSAKDAISDKKLPYVQLAAPGQLSVGDSVYAVGAPQGLELTLSNGLVSGFREYNGDRLIQTTAPISQGSSGGGLFDARGRLVGITTMYLEDGQNLNFAIPAELVASVPDVGKGNFRPEITIHEDESRGARDRWLTVYKDDERTISFDTETVSKAERNVTIWQRIRYAKPEQTSLGKSYVELFVRVTYHCGFRQTSFLEETGRSSSGEVVYSNVLKSWEIERESVKPETIAEQLYEAACE